MAIPVYLGVIYDRAAEAKHNRLHEPVTIEGSSPLGDGRPI